MSPLPRRVVIGVGNPWRRDDGVGHAVAEALRGRVDPDVAVVLGDGEAARLLDTWDGADLAIVVDAVRTGRPPGTLHRVDRITAERSASSHGLGLDAAVELARHLGRLPAELVVLGIEGQDFDHGPGLSTEVRAAVSVAVAAVLEQLGPGASATAT